MGIVTSGTGTGTGTAVKLPSLKLIDDAIITSRDSDSSSGISMEACNQEDMLMLDIASSLEVHVNQHCLALLKSSYATNGLQGIELSIRPHSSRMNVAAPVTVAAVHSHSLSYPTFDKKFSPCPPLDRGSKSSEILLMNVATAAAATGTSDLKTSPPSTALYASAEAERKSAKMIEMAKKVAALKARQQKGIGSSL